MILGVDDFQTNLGEFPDTIYNVVYRNKWNLRPQLTLAFHIVEYN